MYDADKIGKLKAKVSELEQKIAGYEKVETELKESEDRLHQEKVLRAYKMEALGTLAGGIAHDFNNILGIIMGNVELAMDDTPLNISVHDNLREIFDACIRAKDIVQQILPFSYQNRKKLKLLKIADASKNAIKLLRSSIPSSVKIRENIINSNGFVMANETRLNQILINLCTNAVHSMQGAGFIDINLSETFLDSEAVQQFGELSPGLYMKLSVSDTGCGINPDILNKIFDPYFTTKPVGEGTGMGLAVVYGIVHNLGGGISVFSELRKGSVFDIYLPIVESDLPGEDTGPSDQVKTLTGHGHILLVDDEEKIVDMEKKILERMGYSVTATSSSLQALDVFRNDFESVDVIICDMTMPEMFGNELIMEFFKIRKDIPIILCTGYHENITPDMAGTLGVRQLLIKPVSKQDLAHAIYSALEM